MTKTERSRIVALGGIGAVIILLVWGIIATLPKKEDGREEEVRLRSEIKDNFTLKDMLGSVEKEMENRRENRMPGGGITEWMNPRTPFPRKARYSASGN